LVATVLSPCVDHLVAKLGVFGGTSPHIARGMDGFAIFVAGYDRDVVARHVSEIFGLPKPAVDIDLSMQACLSGFKA
jgi:hypothetical protein